MQVLVYQLTLNADGAPCFCHRYYDGQDRYSIHYKIKNLSLSQGKMLHDGSQPFIPAVMGETKLGIENIATVGDELAIAWADGVENYLKFEELRKACPCATCQGEPDAMGRVVRPPVMHNEKSYQLINIEHVGGYAIQLRWADGHGTGIYSYKYLRGISAE